jgi:hypothetical protein
LLSGCKSRGGERSRAIRLSLGSCPKQVNAVIYIALTLGEFGVNARSHLKRAALCGLFKQMTLTDKCNSKATGHDKSSNQSNNGDGIHVSSLLARRYTINSGR